MVLLFPRLVTDVWFKCQSWEEIKGNLTPETSVSHELSESLNMGFRMSATKATHQREYAMPITLSRKDWERLCRVSGIGPIPVWRMFTKCSSLWEQKIRLVDVQSTGRMRISLLHYL